MAPRESKEGTSAPAPSRIPGTTLYFSFSLAQNPFLKIYICLVAVGMMVQSITPKQGELSILSISRVAGSNFSHHETLWKYYSTIST
jgi:hypothetical protein